MTPRRMSPRRKAETNIPETGVWLHGGWHQADRLQKNIHCPMSRAFSQSDRLGSLLLSIHALYLSQNTRPLRVFHGFMECIVVILDGTEVCFDLLHFLSGVHWWGIYMNFVVSMSVCVVPSITHISSFCTLSRFSRFVPLFSPAEA